MYKAQKFKIQYVREKKLPPTAKIYYYSDIEKFTKKILSNIPLEKTLIFALDNANNIIGYTEIQGETNSCVLHPKTVFRFLLSAGASSFILAHNHPANTVEPSKQDWKITHTIKRIGKDIELPLIDHVIITDTKTISLRELAEW